MHSVQLAYVRRNNKTKAIYSWSYKTKIIENDILGCWRNTYSKKNYTKILNIWYLCNHARLRNHFIFEKQGNILDAVHSWKCVRVVFNIIRHSFMCLCLQNLSISHNELSMYVSISTWRLACNLHIYVN